MVIQIIEGLVVGGILSFVSIFRPTYLSKSITPIGSRKIKWVIAIFATVLNTAWILFRAPSDYTEWLLVIFEQLFLFVAVIDTYSKIIPNKLIAGMLLLGLLFVYTDLEWVHIISGVVVFATGVILQYSTKKIWRKNAFGWGDIKLFSVLPLIIGWNIGLVIYITLLTGGLLSIIGIASKKISKKTKISLSVFILLAYIIVEYTIIISFFIPKYINYNIFLLIG